MLELTGFDVVLRGIGILYWLIAIGVLSFAIWIGDTLAKKALWATVAVVIFGFWPAKALIEHSQRQAYAREAWAYFKKKCDTEAGEKIYKTFTGVKSVLVIKPLPPATEKDLYDQFWYGDPYSDANTYKRSELAVSKLASRTAPININGDHGHGYEFVEMSVNEVMTKIFYVEGSRTYQLSAVGAPTSRFGVLWEDISKPEDRKYWVAGSRLRVVDLESNSIVAERIGYLIEAGFGSTAGGRRPWQSARGIGPNGSTCPNAYDWSDRWFLLKVLSPK